MQFQNEWSLYCLLWSLRFTFCFFQFFQQALNQKGIASRFLTAGVKKSFTARILKLLGMARCQMEPIALMASITTWLSTKNRQKARSEPYLVLYICCADFIRNCSLYYNAKSSTLSFLKFRSKKNPAWARFIFKWLDALSQINIHLH